MAQQSRTGLRAGTDSFDLSPSSVMDALGKGEFRQVTQQLNALLKSEPRNPAVHVAAGILCLKTGRVAEAEASFQTALKLNPNTVEALAGRVSVLMAKGHLAEAEALSRSLLLRFPEDIWLGQLLAQTLTDQGRISEAITQLEGMVACHPKAIDLLNSLAKRLSDTGRFEESRLYFEQVLDLEPSNSFAYLGWVEAKTVNQEDYGMVAAMESALSRSELEEVARMEILFALGKAFADLKEFEKSMMFCREANRIRDRASNKKQPFQKELYLTFLDLTREIFTKDQIKSRQSSSKPVPTPIFIFGMFRSGTTLVEQILSSHSQVAAGGEIQYWLDLSTACFDHRKRNFDFERAVALRNPYQRRIQGVSKGRPFVTDKFPGNYRILGLLRILYPNAKFIHCKRHPVDTCLSLYMTPFSSPPNYAGDPEKLVFTYQFYRKMMDYWRSVFERNEIHEVRYEDLVDHPEPTIRQLLEYCGLDFEELCLTPERNSRPIRTASSWQARQPIYRSSKEKWRSYEPWLGEFRRLLEPE